MAPAIPTHDYYVILEVRPSAHHDEIKASFRRLARLHHPDKNNGSRDATIKIQLINVAWEVLGDSIKRIEYDRLRPQPNASSYYNASNHATTPQSSWQPPRPNATSQDDARARVESLKKRQEWLSFEKDQEENIRRSQNRVKVLKAEINALNAKIDQNRAKLANDVPYWWNPLASLSKRLSEMEKNEIRRQSLDSGHATRIKQGTLWNEQSLLQQLEDELTRRRGQEGLRLANEQLEKARRERVTRENAEAEAQKRAREESARQRAAQEAREKAAREEAAKADAAWREKLAEVRAAREAAIKRMAEVREKAAREEAIKKMAEVREKAAREEAIKKMVEAREKAAREEAIKKMAEAREKAAREEAIKKMAEAREKAAREEAEKTETVWREKLTEVRAAREAALEKMKEEHMKRTDEGLKKMAEECAKREERNAQRAKADHHQAKRTTANKEDETQQRRTRGRHCRHRGWWEKVQGRHDCEHCTLTFFKFALQCPGCATIACASCRIKLQSGRTPSVDNVHKGRRGNARSSRANGEGRLHNTSNYSTAGSNYKHTPGGNQ